MFWRNEVASELERLIMENERLHDCRKLLEKAVHDIEGPLHIAEECLYHRESRKGIFGLCTRLYIALFARLNI